MTERHTKGPWVAKLPEWLTEEMTPAEQNDAGLCEVRMATRIAANYAGISNVAHTVTLGEYLEPGANPEMEANARLIAAAPELLEALIEARERMIGNGPALTALRAKADAAIAKATA